MDHNSFKREYILHEMAATVPRSVADIPSSLIILSLFYKVVQVHRMQSLAAEILINAIIYDRI